MDRIPIGLQLYSVRDDCQKDLPGTLSAIAKMGYAGVEFAGYYNYSGPELRKMLDDLGLKCCGTHIGLDTLLGDSLSRTIEFNLTLDNKFLIVPGFTEEYRNSRAAWLKTAHLFNAVAEKIKPHGLQTGYHNHCIEFSPMEGELPWDIFFSNTNPEVIMQFDTGNALSGGADSLPFLKHYPGRAITVHVKEYSAVNDRVLIGEGDVKWDEFFRLCETTAGTEWYIVEQASSLYSPLKCVARCLENMRQMGK